MKKISSIKSLFQRLFVWIFSIVKTADAVLPDVKMRPMILWDHSPEGERVKLIRAAKNFEVRKRLLYPASKIKGNENLGGQA